MKYYIDFDNTLFDTEKFYNDLLNLVNQYDITEDEIKDYYYNMFVGELFNPIKIIKELIKKNKFQKEIIKKLNVFLNNLPKYLYDDAIEFLEYLNEKKCDVNLLTYGDYDYQNEKIKRTLIKGYFNKIIITSKVKSELELDYKNSIFIDDNVEQIEGLLKKRAGIIRIRRNGNKHSINDLNNIIEYENFNEYIKFLEKKDI